MPGGLHRAVQGFDRAAERYERARPGYPPEALEYLREALRLGPGDVVLELGAGTGKFTRAMADWPVRRIAVEPVAGMRQVFRRSAPPADLLIARAESIPVRAGAVDAVVAAQSFHWFRQPDNLAEVHRVLRPGHALGLVWNLRDESVPWVRQLGELIDSATGEVPRTRSNAWRAALESFGRFGAIERRSFAHATALSRDGVVDRVLSISSIGLLDPGRQEEIAARVRSILDAAGIARGTEPASFPYRTDVYLARRD